MALKRRTPLFVALAFETKPLAFDGIAFGNLWGRRQSRFIHIKFLVWSNSSCFEIFYQAPDYFWRRIELNPIISARAARCWVTIIYFLSPAKYSTRSSPEGFYSLLNQRLPNSITKKNYISCFPVSLYPHDVGKYFTSFLSDDV